MKAFAAAAFVYWTLVSAAFAQETEGPPSWMKEVTRLPPGNHADLRPVALEYTLDWNHRINAGRVQLSVIKSQQEGLRFVGDAEGRSTGFARLLYPYDFKARSIVDQDSLRPLTFQLVEQERNMENSYDIIFEPKRQIFTTTSKRKTGTVSSTGRFRFDFGQDVLSSAFYLRSQPLRDGDVITMVVTPFNRPYVTTFKVLGREPRKIKGKSYSTIKLDAQIGKVNQDLSLKTYEKVRRTSLWFSDDQYRIPLELQSQLAFGFVSARLDEMSWLE